MPEMMLKHLLSSIVVTVNDLRNGRCCVTAEGKTFVDGKMVRFVIIRHPKLEQPKSEDSRFKQAWLDELANFDIKGGTAI